jgi:hypothetical protein
MYLQVTHAFAFISYGDRVAITVPGRIFSIVWTLYGLVITGLLVGNLTSALTASVAFTVNEVDLYQAEVIDSGPWIRYCPAFSRHF